MNDQKDKLKLAGLGVVIVIAIVFAIMQATKTNAANSEKVVGTLEMPAGGGRDAEGAGDPGNGPPENR